MVGHYPEGRSGNKGVEAEGMEIGVYDDDTKVFILLKPSSLVGVNRDTGGDPEFMQVLPSAIGPESAFAIPSRGQLVTANETYFGPDGGVRAHVMIYALGDDAPACPQIRSLMGGDRPIGWGALSGLAVHLTGAGLLYAVIGHPRRESAAAECPVGTPIGTQPGRIGRLSCFEAGVGACSMFWCSCGPRGRPQDPV